MIKKLMALILCICAVLTLSGCDKETDFYTMMSDIGNIQNGTIEIQGATRKIGSGKNAGELTVTGRFNERGDMSVKLEGDLTSDKLTTAAPFKAEFMLIDNTAYVDVATLVNSIGNLAFDDVASYTWLLSAFGDIQWVYVDAGDSIFMFDEIAPDFTAELTKYRKEYQSYLSKLKDNPNVELGAEENLYWITAPASVFTDSSEFADYTVHVEVSKKASLYTIRAEFRNSTDEYILIFNIKSSENATTFNPPAGAAPIESLMKGMVGID